MPKKTKNKKTASSCDYTQFSSFLKSKNQEGKKEVSIYRLMRENIDQV